MMGGRMRKVLVQFNRNAFAYTIDRATGEVLVAAPFANENWASGIDLRSGMPMVRADKTPKPNVKLTDVCPPDIGGKDFQPSAFSPKTGLLYAGIFNICMDVTDHRQSWHTLRWHGDYAPRGTGRELGRIHGVGPRARPQDLVNQRKIYDHERRPGDGGRSRFLWNC